MYRFFYILCIFLLYSCQNRKGAIELEDDYTKVVEIPFDYGGRGYLVTKSLDGSFIVLDTGASLSISSNQNLEAAAKDSVYISDLNGVVKKCALVNSALSIWGIRFSNVKFLLQRKWKRNNVQTIVGGDVLKRLCLKIDNKKKLLILSKNSELIPKKGFAVPFRMENNTLLFNLKINDSVYPFLFDTGIKEDISVSNTIITPFISKNKVRFWRQTEGAFFSHSSRRSYIDTVGYTLSSFHIDTLKFKYSILKYYNRRNENIVGTIFMRRFKSITIDYLNNTLYFELPQDEHPFYFGKSDDGEIKDVPAAWLNHYYDYIESIGIRISEAKPLQVEAVLITGKSQAINLGDTIVGFRIAKHNKSKEKFLGRDFDTNIKDLEQEIAKTNSVTLFINKNRTITPLELVRDTLFNEKFKCAYSYANPNTRLNCFGINIIGSKDRNLNIHVPWSNLSKKEAIIRTYKNGKSKILSNKP